MMSKPDKHIFLSWIGDKDLKFVSEPNDPTDTGPIIAFLNHEYSKPINNLYLLYCPSGRDEQAHQNKDNYFSYIKESYKNRFESIELIDNIDINPTEYDEVYNVIVNIMTNIKKQYDNFNVIWHILTSPGTPHMATIWLIISITLFKATLYHSHHDKKTKCSHVKIVNFSLNIDVKEAIQKATKTRQILIDKIKSDDHNKVIDVDGIIHNCQKMKDVIDFALKAAKVNETVLILGETGTGKELIANLIKNHSNRPKDKYCAFNCSAIPEQLIDSTLFGHSKGAFTSADKESPGIFKQHDGGTIFLDEIGDLSFHLQAKLLRVLQNKEIQRVGDGKVEKVDVRIIAATHKDLFKLVQDGKFREDLYYRLNVIPIYIPPLRERGEDIILLAEHFLKTKNEKMKTENNTYNSKIFSNDAKEFLLKYNWPGNVRELENLINRVCVWELEIAEINSNHLQKYLLPINHSNSITTIQQQIVLPVNLEEKLNEIKKSYIIEALKQSKNNKSEASRVLGYNNFQNLNYYIKKLNITID